MSTSKVIQLGGKPRPSRLVALLAATAVATSVLSAPSSPASATVGTVTVLDLPVTGGLVPTDDPPTAVTLITGDIVLWQQDDDGNPHVVEIQEAPRDYTVTFDQAGTAEDFYVIPSDAMEQVVAGTVDEELFNVPGLIRQGLDDATTDELPVIVTFDQDRSAQKLAQDASALPATSDATVVEKLNGAGVRVDRGEAGRFRRAVFGAPWRARGAHTAGARGPDGAVEQILLDRVLEIDLAESVPQVGAPHAWGAGYTGEGVTVAVLDTGIDSSHPDLAGQVVAQANFTDEPDTTDTHGHGTHVASTIAGTGVASDGARAGVAPGAELLSGKVCDSAGECQTSWIMAGMEWAVTQGADIVNMSLGGDPTDGTDPLSRLVNELSAKTDTLFVISAGNNGPSMGRVGSPAAADAALAVGAVSKTNQLALFSSRGPRVGDHAVKPEITAPGVGIVAARAEGTSLGNPVDDHYTSVQGTSMATPHVAGAAALVVQAAPNLEGKKLKDALVSTAADGGRRWFEQGTGRVDIPAVLESPIYATGTVNFGGVDGQAERDIVYTNRTDSDTTLTLDASATDFRGQPIGGVSLSTDTLTVPAHGNASVTVTVVLDLTGVFGGFVTATSYNGMELRTGFGFGPPLHRVTIEVLDSNGDRVGSDTAPDQDVRLTHDTLDRQIGGTDVYRLGTKAGVATGHFPAGTYTVITSVPENKPDAGPVEFTRESLLAAVNVDINTDITLSLDARDAEPIKVTVPRKVDKRNHQVTAIRELVGSGGDALTVVAGGASWPVYATPTPPSDLAPLRMFVSWTLAEPQAVQPISGQAFCPQLPFRCYSETPAYVYNLPILYENGIPKELHERITHTDLIEVPSRFHSEHPDALIRQQFASILPFPFTGNAPGSGTAVRMWFRPGEVTEYFLADDRIAWTRTVDVERRPEGEPPQSFQFFSDDRFPAVEAGHRRDEERWHEAPMRIGMWDVREESLDWLRDNTPRMATGARGGLDIDPQFTVPSQLMDSSHGHGANVTSASWRMWNVDTGVELEIIDGNPPRFPLAPWVSTYRLEQIEKSVLSRPFLTGSATTTWVFKSRPSDAQVPRRYVCQVRVPSRQDVCQIQPLILLTYDLGLDIRDRVPAGRAHRFTVTAGHHSKAIDRTPITSLTVQASFNDGDTWQDARVVGKPKDTQDTGGVLPSAGSYQQFQAVIMIPRLNRTTGFVTLRVQAQDANGGTVDQTIHRAYILK